jgi:hypothetical protein
MNVLPSTPVIDAPATHSKSAVKPRPTWKRFVIPSFSDLLLIGLVVWLLLSSSAGWQGLLLDGDTGWHIRAGDYILDHREVPSNDLFSFSKEGEPWFAWEWGAEVVLALLHRAMGLKGVTLLAGLLIVASGVVVFRYTLWRGANTLLALATSLLAIGASSIHYHARPHLFTLFLLPISVWILERDRRQPWAAIWCLIPLTAIWTNLHGGFMAWIAIAVLLFAGTALETWSASRSSRNWRSVRRYGLLAAGCAAATLLNPYGVRLHQHVVAYLRSDWIRDFVVEFQSPRFRNENVLQFEMLLLAGLIACGMLLWRRRFAEALWIVFWAHQALGSVRHITVYAAIAAPIVALELTAVWNHFVQGAPRQSVRRILDTMAAEVSNSFRWTSAWPAVSVIALVLIGHPIHWPTDFPAFRFPTKIVERHRERLLSGRVMTMDQWADYLIYRLYPGVKVYFDGRSDFYGPKIGKEYRQLIGGEYNWRQIISRNRFNVALVPPDWALTSLLKQDPYWRLLEDDGKALLFVLDSADPTVRAEQRPPGTGEKRFHRTNENR